MSRGRVPDEWKSVRSDIEEKWEKADMYDKIAGAWIIDEELIEDNIDGSVFVVGAYYLPRAKGKYSWEVLELTSDYEMVDNHGNFSNEREARGIAYRTMRSISDRLTEDEEEPEDEWQKLDRDDELEAEQQFGVNNIVRGYYHPERDEYIVMRGADRQEGFFLERRSGRGDRLEVLASPPSGAGSAKAKMERYIAENP